MKIWYHIWCHIWFQAKDLPVLDEDASNIWYCRPGQVDWVQVSYFSSHYLLTSNRTCLLDWWYHISRIWYHVWYSPILWYQFTFYACISPLMQALLLEWRNPLSQLHVILKKINTWTQMMLVIMQSNMTTTFCLICYIWYHIWHHEVTYDVIYCNIWYQIVISYEIIFSILCDVILHWGRWGALGDCTGGTHMHVPQPKYVYYTDDFQQIELSEPLVQWSKWLPFKMQTRF